jgi:hypothetical protein
MCIYNLKTLDVQSPMLVKTNLMLNCLSRHWMNFELNKQAKVQCL